MNFEDRIGRFFAAAPRIDPTAFIAPGASIIGDVALAEQSSVWFQAVLRADINSIRVGPRSNIQDGAVVHLDDDFPTMVGELVTVGHKAILHACTVGDEVLVGMNAILLDGVEVGPRSIIGAGALVTGGKKIPAGSLLLGSPARIVRSLDLEEQSRIKRWAEKYVRLAEVYRARGVSGCQK